MVETVERHALTLLPKQREFCRAEEFEVLYSGAVGAGKSRAVCYKVCQHVWGKPNNVVGLTRKTSASLKRTTLRTLLFPEGGLPPVLPYGSYKWNKADQTIEVENGGTILYFGCDDPLTVASMNLGACGVDQVEELDEEEYKMLLTRCRNISDPNNQLFGACNPRAPSHYLYRRFFKDDHPRRRVIRTRSDDNWFLPETYMETIGDFEGQYRARMVEGEWVQFEGLYFSSFDPAIHVRPDLDGQPYSRFIIAIDEGFANPCAVYLIGLRGGDDRMHVLDEWYMRHQQPSVVVDHVWEWYSAHDADGVAIDPSAAGLASDLEKRGCRILQTSNDRKQGYRLFRKRMQIVGGQPMLTISDRCPNLRDEFESLETDEDRDEPLKGGGAADHGTDAVRYGICSIDLGRVSLGLRWIDRGKDDRRPRSEDDDEYLSPYDDEDDEDF